MDIIQSLKQLRTKFIVYSNAIEDMCLIQDLKIHMFKCLPAIDPRSALYYATGIAAQNQEPVVCIVNSSNESRSVFSGMTEAYYRKLPIILITIGRELDYSTELGDVVSNHFVVSENDDLSVILKNDFPIHIELQTNCLEFDKIECSELQHVLGQILDDDYYLLISDGIELIETDFKCKIVKNRMHNCYEGALANVLGASLARIRKRYIGLVSKNEFLHDINTLGNININDRLLFIVVTDSFDQAIDRYSCSLGFETMIVECDHEIIEKLTTAVNNENKTVIQYIRRE
jgi:hypothetical protein